MKFGTKQFSEAMADIRQYAKNYTVIKSWKEKDESKRETKGFDNKSEAMKYFEQSLHEVKDGSVGIRDSERGAILYNIKDGKKETVQDNLK